MDWERLKEREHVGIVFYCQTLSRDKNIRCEDQMLSRGAHVLHTGVTQKPCKNSSLFFLFQLYFGSSLSLSHKHTQPPFLSLSLSIFGSGFVTALHRAVVSGWPQSQGAANALCHH